MAGYNLDEKSGLFGMSSVKSPQKVLKSGDTAELKHYGIFDPVKVTLTDVREKSIKIKDNEGLLVEGISIGDYVVLRFESSGEKYVLNGRTSEVSQGSPVEAVIDVNRIEKIKDLRKNDKVYTSLKIELKIIGIAEPKPGYVKGVSLSGVKFDCNEDIMLEDIVEGTIKINKSTKCSFKGKVVRKNKDNDSYEYGIEITEIAESNSKVLYDFTYKQLNA